MSLRTLIALWAGKLAGRASRVLERGGGTALPGLVAERLDPRLVARLAPQLGRGSLIVTGTNGKTTTAHMLSSVATAAGYLPLHNRSGSNLMRGIATALIDDAGLLGGLPQRGRRLGVFEVDEATLPEAVRALAPRVLIFTNLFRDQLDRYGEVDAIAARWRTTLEAAPDSTTVVLNADDPSVAALKDVARGPVLFYGVDAPSIAVSRLGACRRLPLVRRLRQRVPLRRPLLRPHRPLALPRLWSRPPSTGRAGHRRQPRPCRRHCSHRRLPPARPRCREAGRRLQRLQRPRRPRRRPRPGHRPGDRAGRRLRRRRRLRPSGAIRHRWPARAGLPGQEPGRPQPGAADHRRRARRETPSPPAQR